MKKVRLLESILATIIIACGVHIAMSQPAVEETHNDHSTAFINRSDLLNLVVASVQKDGADFQ